MLIKDEERRAGRGTQQVRLRVLVVEDHRDTARAVRRILETEGFNARAVGSYKEALHTAGEWVPDLLICDIGLPGKDGLDVMKTMRTAYPGLKGLVISGHADPEDMKRSRAAGFSDHLAKPVDPDRLIDAIHHILGTDPATR